MAALQAVTGRAAAIAARAAVRTRAAVGTHCRNINVTMNDRLADMDDNAH
jgi:hypothetical protein